MKNLIKIPIKVLIIAVAGWICIGPLNASTCPAQPYCPESQVKIVSADIMNEDNASDQSNLAEWTITPQTTDSNGITLDYYLDGSDQRVCQVVFSETTPGVVWDNISRVPRSFSGQDLLIVSGVNVPCDFLPVARMMEQQGTEIYEIKRTVGGQVFVDRVQLESADVSVQTALENGWIEDGDQIDGPMVMIKAVNLRTNALLTEQLWVSGDDWWVYEQSPARQSWRLQ